MDKKVEDLKAELKERKNMCRVLFNRCWTIGGYAMCQFCQLKTDCDNERTVGKNIEIRSDHT